MKISTDQYGRLDVAHHDGLLLGAISEGGKVSLLVRSEPGDLVQLDLCDVGFFSMNNFLKGNLINTIYCWDLPKAPQTMVVKLSKAMQLKPQAIHETYLGRQTLLLVLEATFGAEVIALFEKISVRAEGHKAFDQLFS